MIKTVIRLENNMVMVFGADGEQLPVYQGHYEDVKESVLENAPPEAIFTCWFGYDTEPKIMGRGRW